MAFLNIAQRRLNFILGKKTFRYTAAQAGIPTTTLWNVQKGIRKLPTKYVSALRNLYQREAYHRLHDTGFSAINAKQLSWYAPESVRLKEAEMKMLVNKYTLGGLWQATWKARREGRDFDADAAYEDIKAKVIKGMQKSVFDWQYLAEYED